MGSSSCRIAQRWLFTKRVGWSLVLSKYFQVGANDPFSRSRYDRVDPTL